MLETAEAGVSGHRRLERPTSTQAPRATRRGRAGGTWRGHVRGSVPNQEAGNCLGIRRTGQVTGQASVGLAKGQDAPSSPQGPAGLFPLGKWAGAQAEMKTPSERGSRTRSVNLR